MDTSTGVKFIRHKKAGTKLSGAALFKKIVDTAEEFNKQILRPRTRYWFVVENEADLEIDNRKIKIEYQTQYGTHTFFRVYTSECVSTKAIFTFAWLGRITHTFPVYVAKNNLPHKEDNESTTLTKEQVNLIILIPSEREWISLFQKILFDLKFQLEVFSSDQQLFILEGLKYNWLVLLFPYRLDRTFAMAQYLHLASEAILFLEQPNFSIVNQILLDNTDMLLLTQNKQRISALFDNKILRFEEVKESARSTLVAIEDAFHKVDTLTFGAVQCQPTNFDELNKYLHLWLATPVCTTKNIYVCFRFERGVEVLEEAFPKIYDVIYNVGRSDSFAMTVVNGSIIAYVSCSSSTMWRLIASKDRLSGDFLAQGLKLTDIYEATISDVDKSIVCKDNSPYLDELHALKQAMIQNGAEATEDNRIIYYSLPEAKLREPRNNNTKEPLVVDELTSLIPAQETNHQQYLWDEITRHSNQVEELHSSLVSTDAITSFTQTLQRYTDETVDVVSSSPRQHQAEEILNQSHLLSKSMTDYSEKIEEPSEELASIRSQLTTQIKHSKLKAVGVGGTAGLILGGISAFLIIQLGAIAQIAFPPLLLIMIALLFNTGFGIGLALLIHPATQKKKQKWLQIVAHMTQVTALIQKDLDELCDQIHRIQDILNPQMLQQEIKSDLNNCAKEINKIFAHLQQIHVPHYPRKRILSERASLVH